MAKDVKFNLKIEVELITVLMLNRSQLLARCSFLPAFIWRLEDLFVSLQAIRESFEAPIAPASPCGRSVYF